MVWYVHHFKCFAQFVIIHTVKGFSIDNETEIDIFLEFPCFPYDPAKVGNMISGSSSFSKPSLDIWKFLVHTILKTGMQNFNQDLTSMGDECNCPTVSKLFSPTLLGNWDEDWLFPVLWLLLGHPDLLTCECSALMLSSFRVLNNSTGILCSSMLIKSTKYTEHNGQKFTSQKCKFWGQMAFYMTGL